MDGFAIVKNMRTHPIPPRQKHRSYRANWLRAAVLGANDGIVSVSSLMVAVGAAQVGTGGILTAGVAGLVAGALSMAAGEYVSVSSQRDAEEADLAIEAEELGTYAKEELAELTGIYVARGVEPGLAKEVARQLQAFDALGVHAREELNIDTKSLVNPWSASVGSAAAFSLGAVVPIGAALAFQGAMLTWAVILASLTALVVSGAIGARVGGGSKRVAGLRVLVGGGIAMAIASVVGMLLGRAV